jgi:putative membrane protein
LRRTRAAGDRYSPGVPAEPDRTVVWMTAPPRRQSFLVWLVVTVGINVLALIVVDGLFDGVQIARWWPLILGAAVLGLGNAFLKPVLALLTLPLIVVTFGLAYFFLNVLMLVIAEWIAPDFTISGFWTYVGATIVIWFVNMVVQSFIGAVQGRAAQPRRP